MKTRTYGYNRNYKKTFYLIVLAVMWITAMALYPKDEAKAFIAHPIALQPMPTVPMEARVKEEIRRQAAIYGVDYKIALRIAKCESSLHPEAKNKQSTAKGLYQFTDPTWKYIKAEGHQFDYKENIKQFFIHYPNHKTWWVCK